MATTCEDVGKNETVEAFARIPYLYKCTLYQLRIQAKSLWCFEPSISTTPKLNTTKQRLDAQQISLDPFTTLHLHSIHNPGVLKTI